MKGQVRAAGALFLATAVFAVDAFTSLNGAIAVVYILAILLVAPISNRATVAAGVVSIAFTLLAFSLQHAVHFNSSSTTRLLVSVVAISLTTVMSLRDRMTRTSLVEQARILELSHDTVIIRDKSDTIIYWNDGAELLYGWSRAEAVGRNCASLLQCRFPAAEVEASLDAEGRWSGEVTRSRRDGSSLVLASRWLRRRDAEGRAIGVIESSADVTAQRKADALRRASEQRYRAIFEAAGFATWESDWSGARRIMEKYPGEPGQFEDWLLANPETAQAAIRAAVIRDINPAAIELFRAASREELVGGNLCGRYLAESLPAVARILAMLHAGRKGAESEIRLRTLRGNLVDVVLRVTLLAEAEDWSHVLVMAFDVTERNQSRARIEQASSELAHAARVSLLGQLSASITHEVNQPLTAILNYARSGESWIAREQPDLAEVSSCLARIVANGRRAVEVIRRVKSLARKTHAPAEVFNLEEAVDDAFGLVMHEAKLQAVRLSRFGGDGLPPAYADRVQVQQVLVNLLMNGLQAMREVDGRRKELSVHLGCTPEGMLSVAVRDAGTGFSEKHVGKLFEPFFTTKADGMGMGLSICRSIVEALGGRIGVANNEDHGATVTFSVPSGSRAPRPHPASIPSYDGGPAA